jgi:hypothetical protein
MTLSQFEQALWGLKLVDMQEMVDAGAIDDPIMRRGTGLRPTG